MTDVLLLVPFEPPMAFLIDPIARETFWAKDIAPQVHAYHQLENHVGRPLSLSSRKNRPVFDSEVWPPKSQIDVKGSGRLRSPTVTSHRSLSAVTLVTHLENAGLDWHCLDPGTKEIAWWRKQLRKLVDTRPRMVGICSTFIMTDRWLEALCAVVRSLLPESQLLLGGYYYAVNAKQFLSFDADIFCVGEGELRLPQIVEHVRDGKSLKEIPGLYLRQPDGDLYHTGHVAPLNLNEVPAPNWELTKSISPPTAPASDWMTYGCETQRGCVFKCEFCSYRTLQAPAAMTSDKAIDALFNTGTGRRGYIMLTDATATFPHGRWKSIMKGLAARGGSPIPIWSYARVSDLKSPETVELMARGGVRWLFIGQESGDQDVLNAMKKGTRIDHVRPAIKSLGENGIHATMSFIHGFPGETPRQAENTRKLICGVNDGFEDRPVVLLYHVQPVAISDFSALSEYPDMKGVEHPLGYADAPIPPGQAYYEKLLTLIAVSRVPHTPLYALNLGTTPGPWKDYFFFNPKRFELHRWMKAVERGVGIFLEQDLLDTPPDPAELREVSHIIKARFPEPSWRQAFLKSLETRVRSFFMRSAAREWDEKEAAAGLITRAFIGISALRDFGRVDYALKAWREATYPTFAHKGFKEHLKALGIQLKLDTLADIKRQRREAARTT